MSESKKIFPYAVTGLASTIGQVLPIDEFAARMEFPDRKRPGKVLTGSFLHSLLGLESKSWDRELFSQVETLVDTARRAMRMADLTTSETDALVIVTCTPLWVKLDQDAFAIARGLQLASHVPVLQLHAGCAGLARVQHWLADLPYRNVVTLFYNLASPFMTTKEGTLNPLYREDRRWFSAALFADGASAAVWTRSEDSGAVVYAREVGDPLIHYPAGGAALPPGRDAEAGMIYEIATGPANDYYREGMARNFRALDLCEVSAYYIHQTGAAAVTEHYRQFDVPVDKQHCHAHRYGNLSSPAILVMLSEDYSAGRLAKNARVAASSVGAGPERGVSIFSLSIGDRR